MKEYVDHREEERRAKEQAEEEIRREEMARKRAANAEIHRFRDRVCIRWSMLSNEVLVTLISCFRI